MGFHDIGQFNQALLGKQAWRILKHPSSLLSQILKHRYFVNSSFMDSCVGSRPSFAWRSILHGRELLKNGMIHSVGNGSDIRVWIDKWVFDKVPRTPNYRPDTEVDLTLKVEQLIDPVSHQWNVAMVRQTFADEDVELILKTKCYSQSDDSHIWGFTPNGIYNSRSGYQCLDTLQELQSTAPSTMPPLERALWSNLWKTKTTPKLRHFLWRIFSGALAVRDRLRSRQIPIDATCPLCDSAAESICHLLFTCRFAQEVWQKSLIPLPPAGFSHSSVFLNLHYLISVASKDKKCQSNCRGFPWLLWQIWKTRNSVCFEHRRLESSEVVRRALEDFVSWTDLHHPGIDHSISPLQDIISSQPWSKPPPDVIKCNFGSSWVSNQTHSGVSWIARNHLGATLFHSRRSYSHLGSALENDLMSLLWAAECLRNMKRSRVIFEGSSPEVRMAMLAPNAFPLLTSLILNILQLLSGFEDWSLEHVDSSGNQPASAIAISVTRDHRYPSYIAISSPSWLQEILRSESSLP